MPQHCFGKCCANQGIVFKDCIFTSPETNQSQVIPDASLYFDLIAFYSKMEELVSSSYPAIVYDLPGELYNGGPEPAGPWRP